jgi:hypothetical protein
LRSLEAAAFSYDVHRAATMKARGVGLTKTYNMLHDRESTHEDIARLRVLHAELNEAVVACYGWVDLSLEQGFHKDERSHDRFAISPDARRELLRRLLALNLSVAQMEPEIPLKRPRNPS